MVCANCGSDSHRTNQKDCPKYCTLCAQPGHRQKRGTCPFRVCSICHETGHSARECTSKSVGIRDSCDDGTHQQRDNPSDEVCERCQEHGHNETSCSKPRCKACGSSTHKSAISFECPEHKCSKCQGALDPKGHNRNNCPLSQSAICTLCEEIGHEENRCPTRPCPACGLRTHRLPTHHTCPEHICTTCNEKGHNRSNCPTTQCDTCGLFGHLPNDCPFASCVDVEIDWLNILLSTQSLQTIDSYFEDVSLPPTALRIDGIMRKFDDWEHIQRVCVLLSSENLLEIKRASHTFRRDANREYDRRIRELNKLTQSPINFAFTADYTDDSVPKCPFCRTYLFPQETSKKMWCCGGGKMLELYRPWSQPTDDFRNHCTGDFANAKLFRSESRRLNMTFAFAAYGIKYGQVDSSRKPPYFLKINGIPYYRILTVGNETDEPTNPLHMYMYDSQYNQPGEKKPLPDTLRTIVKNCMLQCNDLAQKLRQLPTEHNIDEVTLHIESDANTARAPSDIAALIVKPKGVAKATPRTLVIYPHNDAFLQDHPTKAGQLATSFRSTVLFGMWSRVPY